MPWGKAGIKTHTHTHCSLLHTLHTPLPTADMSLSSSGSGSGCPLCMGESPLAFTQVWFPSTHRLGRVPVQPRIWGCTCCLGSLSGYQFGVLCPTLLVLPLSGPSSPRSPGFSHFSPLCVPHMVPCATDVPSPGFLPHSVGWGLLDHCNTRDDSEHEEFFNTPANLWSMSKSLLLSLQTSSQKSQFQMVKVVNLKKNPKTTNSRVST